MMAMLIGAPRRRLRKSHKVTAAEMARTKTRTTCESELRGVNLSTACDITLKESKLIGRVIFYVSSESSKIQRNFISADNNP